MGLLALERPSDIDHRQTSVFSLAVGAAMCFGPFISYLSSAIDKCGQSTDLPSRQGDVFLQNINTITPHHYVFSLFI